MSRLARGITVALALALPIGLVAAPTPVVAADPELVPDLAAPVVSGVPQVGGALTVISGEYDVSPDELHYQWRADGVVVGADSFVYRPTAATSGKHLTVTVTASKATYADSVTTSAPTTPVGGGGRLVAWGANDDGQVDVPAELEHQTVVDASAGDEHLLAVTADGRVFAWGNNFAHQTEVPSSLDGRPVVAVAAGAGHSLALTADGEVVGWGSNSVLEATPPAALDDEVVVAIAAAYGTSMALTADGEVVEWGIPALSIVPAGLTGRRVVAVAAGTNHSLALTAEGEVFAWGYNQAGQLTLPSAMATSTTTTIAAGGLHSLALTSDGDLIGWGNNNYGQASVPGWLAGQAVIAVENGFSHSIALTSDRRPAAWGLDLFGETALPAELAEAVVTKVGAGNFDTFAIIASPSATHPPVVIGVPAVASPLTADIGEYDVTPGLHFQWRVDGSPVGTDDSLYRPTFADLGKQVTVTVTADRAGYADSVVTSAPVGPVTSTEFTTPPAAVITGTAQVGAALTAVAGSSTPVAERYEHQWYADGVVVPGATGATFNLTRAQLGQHLTVRVTAVRAGYIDASGTSAPTAAVVTDQAPRITLTTDLTTLRRGQTGHLTWSTTDAATVTGGGELTGPLPPAGTVGVKPTKLGMHLYTVTATNAQGTTTAQVSLAVSLPAKKLKVKAKKATTPRALLRVRTRGLTPYEIYTIRLGKKVLLTAAANRKGRVDQRIKVPAKTKRGKVRLTVTGSLPDRTGTRTVRVRAAKPQA